VPSFLVNRHGAFTITAGRRRPGLPDIVVDLQFFDLDGLREELYK
jgi:hypothetical protein